MKWNETDLKVCEAEMANGTASTSRWFQSGYFSRVVECGYDCKEPCYLMTCLHYTKYCI